MSPLSYIGLIGGICSLAGYAPLAYRIAKGEHQPEQAPWLIWTLSSILTLASYYELGARSTIWIPVAYMFGSAVITALAFAKGRAGWAAVSKSDLIGAIISSIWWIFFDQPFVVLVLIFAVGLTTYIPGALAMAKDPRTKSGFELEGWTLFFMGSIFNLIAVSSWTLFIAALPVALFVTNGVMFGLSLRNSLIKEKLPPENESQA